MRSSMAAPRIGVDSWPNAPRRVWMPRSCLAHLFGHDIVVRLAG